MNTTPPPTPPPASRPQRESPLAALLPAYLLATTSLFFEYLSKTIVFISPDRLIRPLIFFLAVMSLLVWPIHKITRRWHWTGVVLFVFVMVFFLAEGLFNVIGVLVAGALAVWALVSWLRRKKFRIQAVTFLSTVIVGFIFITLFVQAVPVFLAVDWQAYRNMLPDRSQAVKLPGSRLGYQPDIYYIILDGYGRADVLQKYYQYDNSAFIQSLTQKGFVVPANIYSNYPKTSVSVPATLNMTYIQDLAPGLEDTLFWWLMNPFVRDNRVRFSLEAAGYQSVAVASDWDITNITTADTYLTPHQVFLTEVEGAIISKTKLKHLSPLFDEAAFIPDFDAHRELIRYNFKTLSEIPALPGPKFVFAHIVAPHPPFVFDRSGSPIRPNYSFTFNDGDNFPASKAEYKQGYIEQLEYVNQEISRTMDAILAKSEQPPIIILLADHGPGLLTDFTSSANTCLEERFGIFGAYYLPGLEENPIPDDITPVNSFRIIFNEYFQAGLPLLENSAYYYKDTVYIYRIEDISQQLYSSQESDACRREP